MSRFLMNTEIFAGARFLQLLLRPNFLTSAFYCHFSA
jgi:hypothetical protein